MFSTNTILRFSGTYLKYLKKNSQPLDPDKQNSSCLNALQNYPLTNAIRLPLYFTTVTEVENDWEAGKKVENNI